MARKRWQFKTGPHGARVTVEERTYGGAVRLKSYSPARGTYVSRSLGYPVRDTDGNLIDDAVTKAKAAAADFVNRRLKQQALPERPTTFGELVTRFRDDRVSAMSRRHAASVGRELDLLERVIGKQTVVATIDETTWHRLASLRATGELNAKGVRVPEKHRQPVQPRTVQITLKTLAMLTRWGARVKRRGSTTPLLDSDPCSAMTPPTERNPRREMVTDQEFEAMLGAVRKRQEAARTRAAEAAKKGKSARQDLMAEYMPPLLLLAGETGRRIGAICQLRASDLRWDEGRFGEIVWRSSTDKAGVRWIAPMTPRLRTELERFVRERGIIGDGWLFRAPKGDEPLTVDRASKWWREAEEAAGVPRRSGQGWHSLRRRWATARKGLSLRDVAQVGGWKTTQVLSNVYQMADRDTMEAVAVGAKPVTRRAQ